MELDEVILNRRSIRKFTDYYVSDQQILDLVNCARWAPSWANTQSWNFILVRDKAKINMITDLYSATNPARTCSNSCSALLVGVSEKKVAGFKKNIQSTKFSDWFMFDLGMAFQNISLKAHEMGLGTVIVGSMNHEEIAKIIKLPKTHTVVIAMPIGEPVDKSKVGPVRKEIHDMLWLDDFGEKFK